MWLRLQSKPVHNGQQFNSSVLFWRLFGRHVKGNQMFPKSLCPVALSGMPSLSMLHPTSNPTELEGGLLMDVEGLSGPTAINSSPARSGLSGWWNLPTTAACHTIQEGLQTNASSVCLPYCFAYTVENQHKQRAVRGSQVIKSSSVSFCSQWLRSIAIFWPKVKDSRSYELK